MIYYIILFVLFGCAILEYLLVNNRRYVIRNKQIQSTFFIFCALFLTLFCAFRGDIGNDYTLYQRLFKECLMGNIDKNSHIENGYTLLNIFFTYISKDYYFMQFTLSLLMLIIFFKNIKKYSDYPLFTIFIYYVFFYLSVNFVIIRQGFAMAIIILGCKFIENNQPIRWGLVVLLAMQFHATAIVAFPLYFTTKFRISPVVACILLVSSIIIEFLGGIYINQFIVFLSKFSSFLPTNIINSMLVYSASEKYGSHVDYYNLSYVLVKYLMYFYIVFLYCIKYNSNNKNYYMLNFLLAVFLNACGRNFAVMTRLALFFLICGNGLIAYELLLSNYKLTKKYNILMVVIYFFYFSIYFYSTFSRSVKGYSLYNQFVPYQTFF